MLACRLMRSASSAAVTPGRLHRAPNMGSLLLERQAVRGLSLRAAGREVPAGLSGARLCALHAQRCMLRRNQAGRQLAARGLRLDENGATSFAAEAVSTSSGEEKGAAPPVVRDPSETAKIVCEFFLTTVFVFFFNAIGRQAPLHGISPSAGVMAALVVIIPALICSGAHISGAIFNPMVTCVFVAEKRLPPALGAKFIAAQLAGSTFGTLLSICLYGAGGPGAAAMGVSAIPAGTTVLQALVAEAIGAFVLILVTYGCIIDKRSMIYHGPLALGMVLAVMFGVLGPVSGMCLNPAKAFGPALLSGYWTHYWVWWVGPLAGGLLAGRLYSRLWAKGIKNV